MFGRPGRRFGEILRVRIFFRKEAGDLGESAEFRCGHGFENHLVAMLFNEDLGAIETEGPRQPDGLAASMLEYFRSGHSYDLYLQSANVKVLIPVGLEREPTLGLRGGTSLSMEVLPRNEIVPIRKPTMTDETTTLFTVGTRGSELALVQATATESALAAAFPDLRFERRIIKTTGDRRTDVALADVAKAEGVFDKGVFIKELEQALDDGSIDIAVHSLKDLPTVLDPRFALAAVLERASIRDVLVTREGGGFDALPAGARVGTSSVRRAKQVELLRPDLKVVDLRGNVPTRLEKLVSGEHHDAILLAEAGLVRLGYLPEIRNTDGPEAVLDMPGLFALRLEEHLFYPAAGQGAVGLEIRAGDFRSRVLAETIGHEETWLRVTAEREFLRLLDAGCHTPVGVFSSLTNGFLHLKARVFPEAGGPPKTGEASGIDPLAVAQSLFDSLT
jgi:hydroxymethylbilane synthase